LEELIDLWLNEAAIARERVTIKQINKKLPLHPTSLKGGTKE